MRKSDDIIAGEFVNGAPSPTFLNRLNSVSVSKEDIFEVVIEGIQEYREGADRDPGLRAMARLYANQPQRAPAVYFRLQALTRFLKQEASSDRRNRCWIPPLQR